LVLVLREEDSDLLAFTVVRAGAVAFVVDSLDLLTVSLFLAGVADFVVDSLDLLTVSLFFDVAGLVAALSELGVACLLETAAF
jgi:hypothetical protein